MEQKSKEKRQHTVSKVPKSKPLGSKNRRTTRSSAISRINERLPNELLAYIFSTAIISLLPIEHRSFLALVCSVCRHWRDVAIEASELWTTIYIHDLKHIPPAELFLERSKAQLLDVDIQVTFEHGFWFRSPPAAFSPQRGLQVAELTSVHLWHTRTLSLRVSDEQRANELSELYQPLSAPQLVSLSIYIEEESRSAPLLLESICSLRSSGSEGSLSNTIPISSLTRLELTSLQPEHEDMQRIFSCSPSLETLILPKFGRRWWGYQGENKPIIITQCSLRSLAVHMDSTHEIWSSELATGSSDNCCVLASLRFPNLEYLEVLGDHSSCDLNLGGHFKDLPRLKTLRLQECCVSPADAQFFRSLKLLDRLELVDNLEDVKWSKRHRRNESFPFPRLSSILISNEGGWSYNMSQWARLARLAVNNGCSKFSIEVTTQLYGSISQLFGPQEERIRLEVNDHSPSLIHLPTDFPDLEEAVTEWGNYSDEDDYYAAPYDYGDDYDSDGNMYPIDSQIYLQDFDL
ncbi:hypothetical protein F5146DRAFT_1227276 [Armillaria mellea]|nr:hypothetical protein F5146DRAFT_1227276 [Armillaria mellea]